MTSTEALALQALSTPALGASDAMDVLVDALLEADILRGDETDRASDAPLEGQEPRFALRRRAFEWARRRLCRAPDPFQQLVALVESAVLERELPWPVVGIVGPHLLRLHFPFNVDLNVLAATREAVARRLPASIVIETTCLPYGRARLH